jgi:hypothetical protein
MPTTWNPADLLNTTLSGGNLTATGTNTTGGVRSLASVTSSKWYWEVSMSNYSGIQAGIGFGNASASLAGAAFSAANVAMTLSNGNCYVSGTGAGAVLSFGVSPWIVCFALDMGAHRYWVRSGATGSWNATGGTANDPATGVGGFDVSGIAGAALAMALFGASGMVAAANFGATGFSGAVPAGFTAGFGPVAGGANAVRVMVLA